jgi:ABC-type branched-subunit amino acid transport system substrate-binding protein
MEGYVAAKLFTEGLRRAGKSPNRDALINALESVQSLDLGGFVVGYGARSHVASRFVDLSMLTDDGRVRV